MDTRETGNWVQYVHARKFVKFLSWAINGNQRGVCVYYRSLKFRRRRNVKSREQNPRLVAWNCNRPFPIHKKRRCDPLSPLRRKICQQKFDVGAAIVLANILGDGVKKGESGRFCSQFRKFRFQNHTRPGDLLGFLIRPPPDFLTSNAERGRKRLRSFSLTAFWVFSPVRDSF